MPRPKRTALQPPPLPKDAAASTSILRPPTAVQPRTIDSLSNDTARQARVLADVMNAIAVFLGSAPVKRTAADTIKALEGNLASALPAADLRDALKELAARVGAAANELT